MWEKSIRPSSSFSYIGKSTIQAKAKRFSSKCPSFTPDLDPRLGRHLLEVVRLAAKEERRIAGAEAQLPSDRLGALGTDVLGDGAGTLGPPGLGPSRQKM